MKNFILLFALIFSSVAAAKTTSGLIVTSRGHNLAYEMSVTDESQPTLVLFPGINRGLSTKTKDAVISLLKKEKVNWVSFHFAGHPQSVIAAGGKNVGLSNVTLEALAKDSQTLIQKLGIENPVPVTLSYSSAVGAYFTVEDFPLVVDVAPIGKQIDDDPQAESQARKNKANLENMCFLMSPCIEYWTQLAYRNHWSEMVKTQSETNYPELKNPILATQSLDGYVGMARATQDFNITKLDFTKGPERIFVLGRDENSYRFTLQMKAIKAYRKQTGELPVVFLLEGAEHIIPTDQPESYLNVLLMIAKNEIPNTAKFFHVKSAGGKIIPIKNSEVEKLLEQVP